MLWMLWFVLYTIHIHVRRKLLHGYEGSYWYDKLYRLEMLLSKHSCMLQYDAIFMQLVNKQSTYMNLLQRLIAI